MAAYRLDRLLGLDLVPVSVIREVDGQEGAVQFWVEGLLSELDRGLKEIQSTGYCPLSDQYQLMFVFDALIFDEDRTQQNIQYIQSSWSLILIDMSRAFRTHRGRPEDLKNAQLIVFPEFAERLAALEYEELQEHLGDLLERDQVRALLARRDRILADARRSAAAR